MEDAPRYLLLLPPAASASSSDLKIAYGETLVQVLKEVATHSADSSKAAVLEIALACPHLVDSQNRSRASLYQETQTILAGLYKLICVLAAQESVNVEDAEGVDVRVILLAWSTSAQSKSASSMPYNIVVDLPTLAKSGRSWRYAFGVESEAGETLVKAFVEAKGSLEDVDSAHSGPNASVPSTSATLGNDDRRRHHHVAVGGTFDHLHIGHKLLLTMTLFAVDNQQGDANRSATIGITGDQLLVNKKHAGFLEGWTDRQRAVAVFCNAIMDFSLPASFGSRHVSVRDNPGPNGKSVDVQYPNGLILMCTEIQDPFGPTITEENISALIISAETRSGGKAVNEKRKEKKWAELEVFEVDVLDREEGTVAEGFENKLSSTAIREKLAGKAESKI